MAMDLRARVKAMSAPPPPAHQLSTSSFPGSRALLAAFLKDMVQRLGAPFGGAPPAKGPERQPSNWPVLVGLCNILYYWTRPWVAIVLLLVAPLHRSALVAVLAIRLVVGCCCDWQLRRTFLGSPKVPAGLHHADTPENRRLAARLRALGWGDPSREACTRWLWNGDLLTVFPFICYPPRKVPYERAWLEVEEQLPGRAEPARERVALDWAHPPTGYDPSKPVAVVCHGLNGGSKENYVMDFVTHATREAGWTCVVMVNRGFAGTSLRERPFHGARTSDLEAAVAFVREAVGPEADLVGVGFSLGAIVLANYCGVAGARCGLACAVSFSGCYDCWENVAFPYSAASWQPWLVRQLKANFLVSKPQADIYGASGRVDVDKALSSAVRTVPEFDAAVSVPFYGFESLEDYYAAMSVGRKGKLRRVRVPLLAVHAADDPIVNVDTYEKPMAMALDEKHESYNPYCWFKITRRGGHVGWCQGPRPADHRWRFMNQTAVDFATAVLEEQGGKENAALN